ITKFQNIKDKIEINILNDNILQVDQQLDIIENDISSSLYSLLVEMYLNTLDNNNEANNDLVKELSINGKSSKLPIIVEFGRLRMEKDLPAWQYDSTVEHHSTMYPKESEHLVEYVFFKFDPFNFERNFKHLAFIVNFESDFSVIDRYNSIKLILPLTFTKVLELKQDINFSRAITLFKDELKDSYWVKLSALLNSGEIAQHIYSKNQEYYDKIADLFFKAEYTKVAIECSKILIEKPNIQELHSFFIKSILFINKDVKDFFKNENTLTRILTLMRSMMIKGSKYNSNREILLAEYYRNSNFSFSNCLLEDLYYEFRFNVPSSIHKCVFLNGSVISYRNVNAFDKSDFSKIVSNLNAKWSNLVFASLRENDIDLNYNFFHQVELYVITKIKIGNYEQALTALNLFDKNNTKISSPEFVTTWLIKNKILCYFNLQMVDKCILIIIDEYFRTDNFYDHYYNQELVDYLVEYNESVVYKSIVTPIYFLITKQSQSYCYDSIANFLIQHDLKKPSEIECISAKFKTEHLIYFLENCCIKSNLEDSPYLNSIDALSLERIAILNFLKTINPENLKQYNDEILNITKEDTIRKGVKHIHESRIFVDTESLFKILISEITEIFDRYLSLNNQKFSALSSMTISEIFDPNKIDYMFYCIKPVDENILHLYLYGEPILDDNIVRVPRIRYTHFLLLFEEIKDQFIFNEDFGFKSFLSMRIRHGTFSNVLRNVFDKYNLISSKESSTDEYKEIEHWNKNDVIPQNLVSNIQDVFKESSRAIDDLIDLGLSWIKIKEIDNDGSEMFDFAFSELEMKANFINKIGRIEKPDDFINEVFDILYDRLDSQLEKIRHKIESEMSSKFIDIIEQMETNVGTIFSNTKKTSLLEEQIIACKTEIQLVTGQVQKWFKVSRNHYVDEFPIEMILETSLDYANSINGDILNIAQVNKEIQCNSKFKGKYFEGFGDMLINIFDNIIKNNRDLNGDLKINILIESKNGLTKIFVSNNLSPLIDIKDLNTKVLDIKRKVNNYKDGNLANSFEGDSGYLKICRCISADLEQTNYEVNVDNSIDSYVVEIIIENKKLII
ncbi:hypothetical protein A9Q93_06245, partial [Nonlabens dokdonensis]